MELEKYKDYFDKRIADVREILNEVRNSGALAKDQINAFSLRVVRQKDLLTQHAPTNLSESRIKAQCLKTVEPLFAEIAAILRQKRLDLNGGQIKRRGKRKEEAPAAEKDVPRIKRKLVYRKVGRASPFASSAPDLKKAVTMARQRFGHLSGPGRDETVGHGFTDQDFSSTSEVTTFD